MNTTPQYLSASTERSTQSGVAWAAIFAGAAGAAALSMILLLLGSGLGFAASSPWADQGASAKTLGVATVVWLLLTQILASGLGGYLAGRLRVKWASLHGDEVYFRDTAHGFLAWAIATLVTAALVGSLAGGVASSAAKAGGAVASSAMSVAGGAAAAGAGGAAAQGQGHYGYYVDKLLRGDNTASNDDAQAPAAAGRVFAQALTGDGQLDPQDRAYLAGLVAQRTQMSQSDAEQRVDQVYGQARQAVETAKTQAKQAADTAARLAAQLTLWTFVALLCGAFFASFAALFGGRQRDRVQWLDAAGTRQL